MKLVYLAYAISRRTKYNRGPKAHAVAIPSGDPPTAAQALCGVQVSDRLAGQFRRTAERSCRHCKVEVAKRDGQVA